MSLSTLFSIVTAATLAAAASAMAAVGSTCQPRLPAAWCCHAELLSARVSACPRL
jgi:hypothetical protein